MDSEANNLVKAKLDKCPCWLQIKVALALYAKKDVVGVAATGAEKTLLFWIALLMVLRERTR
jgi:superfamily II DNA/RNA helicase